MDFVRYMDDNGNTAMYLNGELEVTGDDTTCYLFLSYFFGIEERIASGDEMEGVEREKPIVVKEKFEASKVKSKTAEEKVLERLNGKNK